MTFESIPAELRALPQWVLWKYGSRDGKPTKLPINANTGRLADTTDPATWTTFENATARQNGNGLGYVFSADDPYTGIDFDACRDPKTGAIAAWAQPWIEKLNSYSEVSPSGTGIKVWVKAKWPMGAGKKKSVAEAELIPGKKPAIEAYDHSRYFEVTGERLDGLPAEPQERQEEIDELCRAFFSESARSSYREGAKASRSSVVERARKYLDTIPGAISGSGGHNQTFRVACVLVLGFGLAKPEALALLLEYNRRCEPPWSDRELLHKVDSADKQEGPRGYLRDAQPDEWANTSVPEYHEEAALNNAGGDGDKWSSDLWPDPLPLGNELPPVEPFNDEFLPESFRPAAKDIAQRMQVPLDFPAVAQVLTLAGAVNRRAEIQPKANDYTWVVKPNLWGGIIAPPGFMKSPTVECATKPLREIEDDYRRTFEQDGLEFQKAREFWELRRNAYRQSITAAFKAGKPLPNEIGPPPEEPKPVRLIINDATFESLHEIMAVNPAGILLIRDELSGFLAQLERHGREGERAFYLEAWNGNTGHTIDRIGRGSIHVPACCVSMVGGIQPNRLKNYFADTLRGGPTDDGLIQRFQLLVWPDLPSGWMLVDRFPDSAALKQVESILKKLVRLDAEAPLRLRFSAEAQELFNDWMAELEAKVRSEDIHPALAGHLSKFRKTMPALALLFELADRGAMGGFDGFVASLQADSQIYGEVSLQHTQQAAAFCDYLESHARRVYACVITPQVRAAHVLASKIKAKKVGVDGVFSLREVYLKGWSGIDSPELAQGAAGILEDASWIRAMDQEPGLQGGRPSMKYEINPKVRQ